MQLTNHAEIRSQQRGIPKEVSHFVMINGIEKEVPGEAKKYQLDKREIDQRIHELKYQIQIMEKSKRVEVIVSTGGSIITVYKKAYKKIRQKRGNVSMETWNEIFKQKLIVNRPFAEREDKECLPITKN